MTASARSPLVRRRALAAALCAGLAGLAASACGALLPPADLKPPSVAFSDCRSIR